MLPAHDRHVQTTAVWLQTLVAIVCVMMMPQRVQAADTGNVLAGLLGTAMALVVICAALGWWARRQGGGSTETSGEQSQI
jgi:hypothetical protein